MESTQIKNETDRHESLPCPTCWQGPAKKEKTPEQLEKAINTPPKKWSIDEWPDLTEMEIFKTTEDYCIENNISIYTQTK